jgi:hypothetical protein
MGLSAVWTNPLFSWDNKDMGRAVMFDVLLAQTLWLQGFPHATIAEKVNVKANTLEKYAVRHGWTKAREAASALLPATLKPTMARDLHNIATQLRETLAEDALAVAKSLRERDPRKMKLQDLELRERTAQSVTRRAWQTLGLDNEASNKAVNIVLLAQFGDSTSHSRHTEEENPSETTIVDVQAEHTQLADTLPPDAPGGTGA